MSPLVSPMEVVKPPQQIQSPEERGAKLMFLAFRHSQGKPKLEDEFTTQAVACHPEWTPDTFDAELSREILGGIVHRLFDKGKHAPTGLEKSEIDLQISSLHGGVMGQIISRAANNETTRWDVEVERTAHQVVQQDSEYVIERGGRPRVGAGRMRSFICHYGLLGNTTGAWEFDGLYMAMRKYVLESMENEETYMPWIRDVRALARIHAAEYPDTKEELLSMIPYELEGRNLFDWDLEDRPSRPCRGGQPRTHRRVFSLVGPFAAEGLEEQGATINKIAA
ncbi:MAG TPA: hypothetical protein VFK11_03900 [Candidatus Saccharimonadales bacterium]|nr:hypothetical protein [Candidatus Saccharimonadales bacterium]